MPDIEKLLNKFTKLSAGELRALDKACGWSLNSAELLEAQAHFRKSGREPARGELETLAQTWSEHCKHKTFSGPVRFRHGGKTKRYRNLFKETIVKATKTLNKPWCLSVFKDNAGVIDFDGRYAVCFKVETHNHPTAIAPFAGAATSSGLRRNSASRDLPAARR